MNKAIFLDRDGTLIEEKNYLSNKKDIEFLDGTFEGLKKLQKDYLLIIITNQSGVARGYFDEEKVIEINNEINKQLLEHGVVITDIFYCPHHKDGIIDKYSIECSCRKPRTGLIDIAVKKYNIDLSKSYVIGDKDSDILLAKNAGCKSILIDNNNYVSIEEKNFVAKNILEASDYILNNNGCGNYE